MSDFQVITDDFVNLQISTSKDDASFHEKRFPKNLTIADLKGKLELITGGNQSTMELQVFQKDNTLVCDLGSDGTLLGSYPIDNGMRLHVVDKFSLRNELDFENVEKYVMPQDVYSKKADSVKAFLMKNKMGKYSDEELRKQELQNKLEEEEEKLANSTVIGSRCKVQIPKNPTKLGTVMYAGKVEGLKGHFIGVKYDEPLGKNDGVFDGKRYFECPPKYGAFVKPQNVTCGDFKEENYDLDEEI